MAALQFDRNRVEQAIEVMLKCCYILSDGDDKFHYNDPHFDVADCRKGYICHRRRRKHEHCGCLLSKEFSVFFEHPDHLCEFPFLYQDTERAFRKWTEEHELSEVHDELGRCSYGYILEHDLQQSQKIVLVERFPRKVPRTRR